MAEAAGLVFGAVGLAGLFSTCLDCFDVVQQGRGINQEYRTLTAVLNIQAFKFRAWGKACGLMPGYKYDERLDEPERRRGIVEALDCLAALFRDSEKLKTRYGLKLAPLETNRDQPLQIDDLFQSMILDDVMIAQAQNRGSTSKRTQARWAIDDGKKFSHLVDQIRTLVEGLKDLTENTEIPHRQRYIIVSGINSIYNLDVLRTIEAAGSGDNDIVSDAASERITALSIADPNGSTTSLISTDTFYTANELTPLPTQEEVKEHPASSTNSQILKKSTKYTTIMIQDRRTRQIFEERMTSYVKIGIRLLYKSFVPENKRVRRLLRSLSFKQGQNYDDPASTVQISAFVEYHHIDLDENLLAFDQFRNFNEFFSRALKPGARPCAAPDRPEIVVSPADCRAVVFPTVQAAQQLWIKGREFSVQRLIGPLCSQEDVSRYINGSLGIFRLAPQDIHRFYVPVDGVLGVPRFIEGEYYTLNPVAVQTALDVYGENVRVVVSIDSVKHGRVTMICIGGMMVGSIVFTRKAGETVKRAEELGYFKFGGSTIILLFEPGNLHFDKDLVQNSNKGLQTLIRIGMSAGHHPDYPPHP